MYAWQVYRLFFTFPQIQKNILQGLLFASQYWLAEWTRRGDEEQEDRRYVTVFGILTGALVFVSVVRAISFFVRALMASRKLHDKVFPRLYVMHRLLFGISPPSQFRFARHILSREMHDVCSSLALHVIACCSVLLISHQLLCLFSSFNH